jgi:hypothetical protein
MWSYWPAQRKITAPEEAAEAVLLTVPEEQPATKRTLPLALQQIFHGFVPFNFPFWGIYIFHCDTNRK